MKTDIATLKATVEEYQRIVAENKLHKMSQQDIDWVDLENKLQVIPKPSGVG